MKEADKLATVFYTHWYLIKQLYVLWISSAWPARNNNTTLVNNKHSGTWILLRMTSFTAYVECLLNTNSFFIESSEVFFHLSTA